MRATIMILVLALGVSPALGQTQRQTSGSSRSSSTAAPRSSGSSPARADPKPDPAADVPARLEHARALAKDSQFGDAASEYVWLWLNIPTLAPAQAAFRYSGLAGEMSALVHSSAEAKSKFVDLRNAAAELAGNDDAKPDQIRDWAMLNAVLGDGQSTVDWFDRRRKSSDSEAAFTAINWILYPLLERRGRWADVLLVMGDPLHVLAEQAQFVEKARTPADKQASADATAQALRSAQQNLRAMAARAYAALLATGHQRDADDLAQSAFAVDPRGAMKTALVGAAIRAGKALPSHGAWLDEAQRDGEDTSALRQQWTAALNKGAPAKR